MLHKHWKFYFEVKVINIYST